MASVEIVTERWRSFFSERVRRHQDLVASYVRYVERQLDAGLPPIFDLTHLAQLVGIETDVVAALVNNTKAYYRTFSIPKRRGGLRTIDAPIPSLLICQKWVSKSILSKHPLHSACHGFREGRSILTNAAAHLGSDYLLKLDIHNFFPSIGFRRGLALFRRLGYPPNVCFYLTSLCFLEGKLPQGSAASPGLSNIIASKLDHKLASLAESQGIVYTRYADDLTFSGRMIDAHILGGIIKTLLSEGFRENPSKTLLLGPGRKKIITGISISSGKPKLPRSSVRAIKLKCYHLITKGAQQHMNNIGEFDPLIVERVIGQVSFWLQVEPDNVTAQSLLAELETLQLELDFA